jgi:hypothetical protein
LLRGAAKNKNATDNTDSCRDLSGRRLRHVNAEKKLKEWQVRINKIIGGSNKRRGRCEHWFCFLGVLCADPRAFRGCRAKC